ncbi:sporulation protein YjcZ [Kroppenstedtia sanguinis]|uniref:Sporulation protein YjcZ n=1 Tax=Kroppenstedtia sanguinis TaxID=1380684 RepID=A0ABW4CAB3_9BACL
MGYGGYGGGGGYGYGFSLGRLLIFLLVIATIFALVGSFGY